MYSMKLNVVLSQPMFITLVSMFKYVNKLNRRNPRNNDCWCSFKNVVLPIQKNIVLSKKKCVTSRVVFAPLELLTLYCWVRHELVLPSTSVNNTHFRFRTDCVRRYNLNTFCFVIFQQLYIIFYRWELNHD